MWALIYNLKEVKFTQVNSIEEVKSLDYVEAHVFDANSDTLLTKDKNDIHLENQDKDKDNTLHFDEQMFISTLFRRINKNNFKFASDKEYVVVIRNYLDYTEDGILYISGSRLVEVKQYE